MAEDRGELTYREVALVLSSNMLVKEQMLQKQNEVLIRANKLLKYIKMSKVK